MPDKTLVIQSHRNPLPYPWLQRCIDSVVDWARHRGYRYRYFNDEIFQMIPAELYRKIAAQKVIATDLARLYAIDAALKEGFDNVVWLDADFYIFKPESFVLPQSSYAVGREVWIQEDKRGRLKTFKKVHNAFLMFRQQNTLLDFYRETAEKFLYQNTGQMPPQFIGPKLLTAIHNVCQLPVMESAGMLSPLVLNDIHLGQGKVLQQFIQQSEVTIHAANLCSSLTEAHHLHSAEMRHIMDNLDQNILI